MKRFLLTVALLVSPWAMAGDRVELTVGALTLVAPAELRAEAVELARRAESALPGISSDLGVEAAAPYRIFLIPAAAIDDPELLRLDAAAPRWASGFLMAGRRVGALRVREAGRYPYSDLLSVLVHECVHMLLHDGAGRNVPRWFGEGVATLAGRRWGPRDVLVYSSSLLTRELPTLDALDRSFGASSGQARVAYAASFDFVSWAVEEHGDDLVRRVVAQARSRPFADAWEAATGSSLADDEASWRRGSLIRYRWIPVLTGTTTLWIGISALFLLAVARRRARSREILERWERESSSPAGATPPDES